MTCLLLPGKSGCLQNRVQSSRASQSVNERDQERKVWTASLARVAPGHHRVLSFLLAQLSQHATVKNTLFLRLVCAFTLGLI